MKEWQSERLREVHEHIEDHAAFFVDADQTTRLALAVEYGDRSLELITNALNTLYELHMDITPDGHAPTGQDWREAWMAARDALSFADEAEWE